MVYTIHSEVSNISMLKKIAESIIFRTNQASLARAVYLKQPGVVPTAREGDSFCIDGDEVRKLRKERNRAVQFGVICDIFIALVAIGLTFSDSSPLSVVMIPFVVFMAGFAITSYMSEIPDPDGVVSIAKDSITYKFHSIERTIKFSPRFSTYQNEHSGMNRLLIWEIGIGKKPAIFGPIKGFVEFFFVLREKLEAWMDAHGAFLSIETIKKSFGNEHPLEKELISRVQGEIVTMTM